MRPLVQVATCLIHFMKQISEVVLRSNDYDFSQTLMLHAYDEQSAEYGLRSDKLELQTGEYTVVGFIFMIEQRKNLFCRYSI